MAAMAGGLFDHVHQRVAQPQRHPLAARSILEAGNRDDLPGSLAFGLVGDDHVGEPITAKARSQ
jgi:hypothetical protein